ncbi:helix-turn-helix domain-containing protein [Mesorhizobium sp. 8]|uniref:helix-turn-helix domain-containing protein n=1 Tax=Mesorhizobium sp. 8 TaxID=2584466 RepID=UPI001120B99D|nr:helix-turn-helix domain-containing protein [Mesorhizobium sp. 8]QDB99298.1 helix-turn-helix domain-containing protein [Mesorhizobium sp. 8]
MLIKLPRKSPADAATAADNELVSSPTKLLTVKEAAAFAVVSPLTVRRWLKAGFLRTYRAGHQIRIDKAELIKSLSQ